MFKSMIIHIMTHFAITEKNILDGNSVFGFNVERYAKWPANNNYLFPSFNHSKNSY